MLLLTRVSLQVCAYDFTLRRLGLLIHNTSTPSGGINVSCC